MKFDKIFEKLEKKILSKSNLTLYDRLILERIHAKDEKLIIELLLKQLEKIKSEINKLEKIEYNKEFTFADRAKLNYLRDKKRYIVKAIKEYNWTTETLSDFISDLIVDWLFIAGEIIWDKITDIEID